MAEKERKEFKIKIGNELIDVSEDIYLTYYRMRRRENFLEEKDQKNGTVKYSELDTNELLGIEMLHEPEERMVEDTVSARLMSAELHKQMVRLDSEERDLLEARYWRNLSQRELALQLGVSQQVISYREKQRKLNIRQLLPSLLPAGNRQFREKMRLKSSSATMTSNSRRSTVTSTNAHLP